MPVPTEPPPDSENDLRLRLARTTSERDAARMALLSLYSEHPPRCSLMDALDCTDHQSCQRYRLHLQTAGMGYSEALRLLGEQE